MVNPIFTKDLNSYKIPAIHMYFSAANYRYNRYSMCNEIVYVMTYIHIVT